MLYYSLRIFKLVCFVKGLYNEKMELRNELKSLIAKNGTTLKKVCEKLTIDTGKSYIGNNITNKLRRKTIKFEEVQEILDVLGYHIEFIRND